MKLLPLAGLLIALWGCTHEMPHRPNRTFAIETPPDEVEVPAEEPTDTTAEAPGPGVIPPNVVIPDVGNFDCDAYGAPGTYKVEFRIHNRVECGMIDAVILYGTAPANLKPANTETTKSGLIVANISDMDLQANWYYVRCRIIMANWVYDTELYSPNSL